MAKPYDPGRMRNRVTWQTNDSGAKNRANDIRKIPIDRGTFYAEVISDGGTEDPNGNQQKAVAKGKLKMRNVGPIKPSDRLVMQPSGRILNIMSVTREGERNAYLIIEFRELKNPQ